MNEAEWKTRKDRIDPRLDACGWVIPPKGTLPLRDPYRSEEEETDNGPADYVLWLDGRPVAILEAKKVSVGVQACSICKGTVDVS